MNSSVSKPASSGSSRDYRSRQMPEQNRNSHPQQSRHGEPSNKCPSDSSVARHRWQDDGGPSPPDSGGPYFRCVSEQAEPVRHADNFARDSRKPKSAVSGQPEHSSEYELVVLPCAEYSAIYPERLAALRERLHAEPADATPRFLIVDATRVTCSGGLLLGVLHAAAGKLLSQGRRLVLAGNLKGLVEVSRLSKLCHVAASREAAIAWCRGNA